VAQFTILFVDDDGALRELVRQILVEQGFRVLTAMDATDALAILARQPVDVLFTDIVMPGKSGVELAAEARRLRPGLRVLFATGYAQKAVEREAMRLGKTLLKPVRRAEMIREIKTLLPGAA